VAILTKLAPTAAGTRQWEIPGESGPRSGFAFASIPRGSASVVCLVATCGKESSSLLPQLALEAATLKNRTGTPAVVMIVPSFVEEIDGGPELGSISLRQLETRGYQSALRGLAPGAQATFDSLVRAGRANLLLVEASGFTSNPQLVCGQKQAGCITSCDLELDAAAAAASEARNANPPKSNLAPKLSGGELRKWGPGLLVLAGAVLGFSLPAGLLLLKRRRTRSRSLVRKFDSTAGPDLSPAYTVVLAPRPITNAPADRPTPPYPNGPLVHVETPITTHTQSAAWQSRALAAEAAAARANTVLRAGLLPELSRWLKQKLVRKLISDRAEMIQTQQAAARQVRLVDERLARIEAQVKLQTQAYVHRIQELTQELQAARNENRELIKARIAQVKVEMEAARQRVLNEESKEPPNGP